MWIYVVWHGHVIEDVHKIKETDDIGIYSSTKWKIDIKICSLTSFRTLSRILSTNRYPLNINNPF